MTHDPFIEKISLWLDNELSPAEVKELQTHLAQCPACQQIYRAMHQIDVALQRASAVMATPKPGFSSRFETRLTQQHARRWRVWVGLAVLFITSLVFAVIGAVVGWMMLTGVSQTWLNWTAIYYILGELGGTVNQVRALINLAGLFLKAAYLTMNQPMFWGHAIVTIVLTVTWIRVMQLLYRRTSITALLTL